MTKQLQSCSCGAWGIADATGEVKFCSDLKTLEHYTGMHFTKQEIDNALHLWGCNHCCNHWGLDLCECGSGEPVGECECGSHEPSERFNVRKDRPLWVY